MTYIFFKTKQIYLIAVVPKLLSTINTNILPKFFKVTILSLLMWGGVIVLLYYEYVGLSPMN